MQPIPLRALTILDTRPVVPALQDTCPEVPALLDTIPEVPALLDTSPVVPDLLDIIPVVQDLVIKATQTHNLPQVHLEIVRPLKGFLVY